RARGAEAGRRGGLSPRGGTDRHRRAGQARDGGRARLHTARADRTESPAAARRDEAGPRRAAATPEPQRQGGSPVIDGVNTSTTAQTDITSSAVKGGQMGKQEFLQLLVTQLRHQDPLNPSDPQDFAAQLAQFSTLEQLVNTGEQLKASAASDQALIQMFNSSSALNLIGKSVVAEGNGVTVPQGGGAVDVTFSVGG